MTLVTSRIPFDTIQNNMETRPNERGNTEDEEHEKGSHAIPPLAGGRSAISPAVCCSYGGGHSLAERWTPTTIPSMREGVIPPCVLLVSGYKRTGKTTFGVEVTHACALDEYNTYRVLSRPGVNIDTFAFMLNGYSNSSTVSFASGIKDVFTKLSGISLDEIEKDKDTKLHEGVLIREHLKAIGSRGRAFDKDYWVLWTVAPYCSQQRNDPIIITDLRFKNEAACVMRVCPTTTTVRLFRMNVPIPPSGDITEHDMDDYQCDFLCIPNTDDDERAAKAALPVYASYVKIGRWAGGTFTFGHVACWV